MNFTSLKYFVDTISESSIMKASKLNYVSQPAISQGIKKLEENLEISLLHHKRNSIQATKDGMALYKASAPLFDAIKKYHSEVDKIKNTFSGKLVIGASNSLVPSIVASNIKKFSKKYQDIKVDIKIGKTSKQIELIEQGLIDVGITIHNGNLSQYNKIVLKRGQFNIVSKGDACKKLLLTESRPETITLEKALKQSKNTFDSLSIVDSWSTIYELVLSGYAAGFLPDFITEKNNSLINLNKKFKVSKIDYEIVCFSKYEFNSLISTKAFVEIFK